jgi:hypothetical protein
MEEVSCSDLFSEGQLLGLELAIEIRAIVLRVKQAGDWRLETGDWRLETGDWRLEVGGIRLVTEDHSKDVLFPPRLRVSA